MDDETSKIKQAQPYEGLGRNPNSNIKQAQPYEGLGRNPNSNIKQAQPKQGLETGGLISGKERIAQEYAPALSGAKGPVAQFDAVDEIAGLRAQQAIDGLTFSSPAGSPAVFGRNGNFSIANSQARRTAKDPTIETPEFVGLLVSAAGSTKVRVSASVVSGMGAWAVIPKIDGDELTDDPPPELTVGSNQWVALKMEIEPGVETYSIDGGDTSIYRIQEGAGTLVGDIEVLAFADSEAMESESMPASVDPETGDVVENGKYIIPLANNNGTGWMQVGYTGPLGVRMCASGAFVALSPARGPIIQG